MLNKYEVLVVNVSSTTLGTSLEVYLLLILGPGGEIWIYLIADGSEIFPLENRDLRFFLLDISACPPLPYVNVIYCGYTGPSGSHREVPQHGSTASEHSRLTRMQTPRLIPF